MNLADDVQLKVVTSRPLRVRSSSNRPAWLPLTRSLYTELLLCVADYISLRPLTLVTAWPLPGPAIMLSYYPQLLVYIRGCAERFGVSPVTCIPVVDLLISKKHKRNIIIMQYKLKPNKTLCFCAKKAKMTLTTAHWQLKCSAVGLISNQKCTLIIKILKCTIVMRTY